VQKEIFLRKVYMPLYYAKFGTFLCAAPYYLLLVVNIWMKADYSFLVFIVTLSKHVTLSLSLTLSWCMLLCCSNPVWWLLHVWWYRWRRARCTDRDIWWTAGRYSTGRKTWTSPGLSLHECTIVWAILIIPLYNVCQSGRGLMQVVQQIGLFHKAV